MSRAARQWIATLAPAFAAGLLSIMLETANSWARLALASTAGLLIGIGLVQLLKLAKEH